MEIVAARPSHRVRRYDSIEQIGDGVLLFYEQRPDASFPSYLLMAAILTDARACLGPGALVDPQTRADTIAWVNGEIESAPLCSFREVCAILELDEVVIRKQLLGRASD
jgi:hypothetical protein